MGFWPYGTGAERVPSARVAFGRTEPHRAHRGQFQGRSRAPNPFRNEPREVKRESRIPAPGQAQVCLEPQRPDEDSKQIKSDSC